MTAMSMDMFVRFLCRFVAAVAVGLIGSSASAQTVAGGAGHTVVLAADGTVWTVGADASRPRGPHARTKGTPVKVHGVRDVVAVAAGAHHTMALTRAGRLYVWGDNSHGQLGDRSPRTRTHPERLDLKNIVAIAAGARHSVALRSNGEVYTWGDNTQGQLGTGERRSASPARAATGVLAIAAGFNHTLFVKRDGTVWAVGSNAEGQLGDGTRTQRRLPVPMPGVAAAMAAAGGETFSVILLTDGTIVATGDNSYGQLGDGTTAPRTLAGPASALTNITAVAAGSGHVLARQSDGAAWAWGLNSHGQVGDGTTIGRRTPTHVGTFPSIAHLGAGHHHSLAVTPHGVVGAWGGNAASQLGDGTTVARPSPIAISDVDYTWRVATPTFDPAAGTGTTEHTVTIAVATQGATIRYTQNGSEPTDGDPSIASGGRLTILTSQTPKARAFKAGAPPSNTASAAYELIVAPPTATPGGATYASPQTVTLATTSPGATLRYTTDGSTPTVSSTAYVVPIAIGTGTTLNVAGFRAGWTTSSVITASYEMQFGILQPPAITPVAGNYEGQVTATLSSPQPDATIRYTIDGTPPSASATVYAGPIVIGSTTTLRAMAFHPDYATSAEASSAYSIAATTPTLSAPSGAYAPGSAVTIGSPDAAVTLHMTLDGTDPTTGSPEVASGTSILIGGFTLKVRAFKAGNTDSAVAAGIYTVTAALGAGAVTAGDAHTVLVSPDGLVYAWGLNSFGQLGDGTETTRLVPTLVQTLTGVTSVAAGQAHTLARTWDGQVYAWGANDAGQVGDGTTTVRDRPVQVSVLTNVVAVAAGYGHSLALTTDGRVLAWGLGDRGQLGLGSTVSQAIPTEVPGLTTMVGIAAGDGYSLAVTAGGQLYAWGANASSAVGDGTTVMRTSPVRVGLANVAGIAAGASHALALLQSGVVYVWGAGTSGQLGLGTTTLATTPTPVPGLTASAIAAGGAHSSAIRVDGALVAWGANASGQVGDGSTVNRSMPTVISGPGSVSALALGGAHAITVAPDGGVSTWGEGSSGQLGDGGPLDRLTPLAMMATRPTWAPAAPLVGLATGTFTVAQAVVITSSSPGAVVRYTLTGTDPMETDQAVPGTGVVDIVRSAQLRARAFVAGRLPGAIARADYTLQVAVPVMAPAPGAYTSAPTVVLTSSDPVAALRYTLDGTDPTNTSPLYTGPFVVDTSVTVTARAFRPGWLASNATRLVLEITALPTAPVASLASGVYPDPVAIALSFLPDTTIRYTLDGRVPSPESPLYVTPIAVASGSVSIKAIAFRTDGTASDVLSATYTIDAVAPTITASTFPSAINGWHNTPVTVTFTCQDNLGLASCSPPMTITTEGTGLIVTGTAVDGAGRQTALTVTLNLDLEPPTVTLTAPADGLATSDTTVLLTGQITDRLSGVVAATCNGTAAVVGDAVSCSVPLRPGRNAVTLTARDAVGHSASAGVTVIRVGTATRLSLTPSTRTMLMAEVGTLSLLDNFGVVVPSATWTSSRPAVVSLSADDPPVLTALAAGQTTIRATKNSLSSAATITVVLGTSVPDGTTGLVEGTPRWTVAPTPLFSWTEAPIYPHPVEASGPDVFMVEHNSTTSERTVRAITASGEVLWLMASAGVPLMGDVFGGIVAGVEPPHTACRAVFGEVERCYTALTRFAGPAGTATWRYDSPGLVDRPAQGPDGTIYVIEHVTSAGPRYHKSIVILDGATGAVTARVPLASLVTDTTATNSQSSCPTSTHGEEEPSTAGPIVAGDGFGYLLVSRKKRTLHYACGSGWVGGTFRWWQDVVSQTSDVGLTLLQLSRTGAGIARVIDARQCTSECVPPTPKQLLPDGIGGLLAVAEYRAAPDWLQHRVTRFDGAGERMDTPLAQGTRIELIGQGGTAYLNRTNGSTSLAKAVVDVRTWTTRWSLPLELAWLAASPDGGAIAQGALGELVRFNGSGQIIGTIPLGLKNPVQEFGSWVGNSAAGLSAVAGAFDDATRWDATFATIVWSAKEPYGFASRQRNLQMRNPGMGIFAKSHWAIQGISQFHHYSIRIVPANQGFWRDSFPIDFAPTDVFGNRFMTIGAGPREGDTSLFCTGTLTKGINRGRDVSEAPSSFLQVPIGLRIEDHMIGALRQANANYDNDLPYTCNPDSNPGFYNSNSYAAGLLNAVGLPRPTLPPSLLAPGWFTPVPAGKFR